MSRPLRINGLLAKPPQQYHFLDRVKTIAGRPITAEDYHGVHTTTMLRAAGYAYSTAKKCRCGYPVIIELDVTGMKPLPDVDAMMVAEGAVLDNYSRRRVKEMAEEYDNIFDAIDEYSMDECESDERIEAGSHWTQISTEFFNCVNLAKAFQNAYGDNDAAWEAFKEFGKSGTIAQDVLGSLTDQKRWMYDFGPERVQRIISFKPIWEKILEDYWHSGDKDHKKEVERIKGAGYDVVTLEDAYSGSFSLTEVELYLKSGVKRLSGEFHGTSSVYCQRAFPEIKIPNDSPFQVSNPYADRKALVKMAEKILRGEA